LQTCSGNDQDFFEVATEDISTGNIYVAGTSKTNNAGCKTSPYNGGGGLIFGLLFLILSVIKLMTLIMEAMMQIFPTKYKF
jgi:hypothetical protein